MPSALEIASPYRVRGHSLLGAGDGGLPWSQPNRASEAEVVLEPGKPYEPSESDNNTVLSLAYLLLSQGRQL